MVVFGLISLSAAHVTWALPGKRAGFPLTGISLFVGGEIRLLEVMDLDSQTESDNFQAELSTVSRTKQTTQV